MSDRVMMKAKHIMKGANASLDTYSEERTPASDPKSIGIATKRVAVKMEQKYSSIRKEEAS